MKINFCNNFCEEVFTDILGEIQKQTTVEEKEKKILKKTFVELIFKKSFKSLVYCLNNERIEKRLKGNSPEERYNYFSNTEYGIEVIDKIFPTLREQLKQELTDKIRYVLSVLRKYEENSTLYCTKFYNITKQEIINIKLSGDWHNNRCVMILELDSGNKIVYKPTHGKNIRFLKNILGYFFEEDYLKKYEYIEDNDGLWVKFVEHVEIHEEDSIKEFYFNYGKLIVVSYLLGMNDMHYENIIASGKYPVISDYETIFSSYLFYHMQTFGFDAQQKVVKRLLHSVNATGLIPIYSMTQYFGGDVSGLSNNGFMLMVENIKNPGKDNMYIYQERQHIITYNHLPNKETDPLHYQKNIEAGFEAAQKIVKRNKEKISKFILDNMEIVESRIILNMTKAYSGIIRIKNNPQFRMNEEAYRNMIERLKTKSRFNKSVYEYELAELIQSDIPGFYWNCKEKSIYGYTGIERKNVQYLEFTVEDMEKILAYQIKNLKQQKKLVKDAIQTTLVLNIKYQKNTKTIFKQEEKEVFLIEHVNECSVTGGDNTIAWIGLMVNDSEQLEYAMLDESIYSGIVGLGKMYLFHYIQKRETKYKDILKRIIHTLKIISELEININSSYFKGWAGIYSFLIQCRAHGFDEEEIELCIKNAQQKIVSYIENTSIYDTLAGIHSAIIYFYSIYQESREDVEFAECVLTKGYEKLKRSFDVQVMKKNFGYSSFAHGYSGAITSLLCLYAYKKDDAFLHCIKILYECENQLKRGQFKWLDRRCQTETFSDFWCHGSLGIMCSRLIWIKLHLLDNKNIGKIFNKEKIEQELYEYCKLIESGKLCTDNYSLCHGNFALFDYLISYYKLYPQKKAAAYEKFSRMLLEKAQKEGYSCFGASGAINSIGFMVGETGIQYELERYADCKIPSILVLETI